MTQRRLRLVVTPGTFDATGEGGGGMLGDYETFLRRRELADGTIYKRVGVLEATLRRWGTLELQPEQIETLLDERGLTGRSRYAWVSHLAQFYRWAVPAGHVSWDPTPLVVRPRSSRSLPRPIATTELRRALAAAHSPTMRLWLMLAAYQGLRAGEIAALHWSWVTEDGIRVRGKGGHTRVVPLHPEVAVVLGSWPVREGHLFVRPAGTPWPAAAVSREMAVFLERCGIRDRAHGLRHWFGTECYRASKDLRLVQELMGHQSPITTAGYSRVDTSSAASLVASLAA